MAHSSSIFSRVPIEVPNRSGFDMSHENLGTATCGTLIPVLVDELLPNDTVSLGSNFQVQLPPMVSDFYGRVDWVLEAFFCPTRLCWGGWQSFMTHPTANPVYPEGTPIAERPTTIPQLRVASMIFPSDLFGPGTLADYLGVKGTPDVATSTSITYEYNALPFIAYHRIWHDWYRDSRIQSPVFAPPRIAQSGGTEAPEAISYASSLPYVTGVGLNGQTNNLVYANGAGVGGYQFIDEGQ